MGASFDHGEDGNLHLAREGGHSHRRIVHAADMTGREIERALLEAVVNDPNIFMFEHFFAVDLLTSQVCFLLCNCSDFEKLPIGPSKIGYCTKDFTIIIKCRWAFRMVLTLFVMALTH